MVDQYPRWNGARGSGRDGHRNQEHYYSANAFRQLKANVDIKLSEGFQPWSLKTLRATFCNLIMDEHPEMIEDVTNAMGHVDTNTTRKFYRRTIEEDP